MCSDTFSALEAGHNKLADLHVATTVHASHTSRRARIGAGTALQSSSGQVSYSGNEMDFQKAMADHHIEDAKPGSR